MTRNCDLGRLIYQTGWEELIERKVRGLSVCESYDSQSIKSSIHETPISFFQVEFSVSFCWAGRKFSLYRCLALLPSQGRSQISKLNEVPESLGKDPYPPFHHGCTDVCKVEWPPVA